MVARTALATVGIVAMLVGDGAARTAPTPQGTSNSSDQAIIVGCVAHAGDGFLIRTTASSVGTQRRSAGTNSAKASTPIAGSHNAPAHTETAGSNSPKASTPLKAATAAASGRRTGGVTTPKGSVPIVSTALPEVTYELDADPDQLSLHADHIVEISGTIVGVPSSAAARKLKVEHMKVLSSTCAR